MTFEPLLTRLEGDLVVLEPLAETHRGDLTVAAADPRVWQWMGTVSHEPEAFDRWFDAALAESAAGISAPYAIVLRERGEAVGSSRYLALRPEHRGLEIGYTWHAPRVWGTGVNVAAKLLLLRHAFGPLDCMRVEFKTDARNERSRGALAALPARFEGIFRKHMLVRDGEVRDSAYYAITDDDWPEVERSLTARLARLPRAG